jgi:hypothetical protein
LTFTGVNRQSDKAAYAKGDEANESFKIDDWDKFIFPGYTATPSSANA